MKKIIILLSIIVIGCEPVKSDLTKQLEKKLYMQHQKIEAIKDSLIDLQNGRTNR